MKLASFVLATFLLLGCGSRETMREPQDYLGTNESLQMEKELINQFFIKNKFDLHVDDTRNIPNSRIFLHDFMAGKKEIERMINILQLDTVNTDDFINIHTRETVNTDFRVHSPLGLRYLQDPAVWFYKAEADNAVAQTHLSVTKTYLYFNTTSLKACLQIYHGWG